MAQGGERVGRPGTAYPNRSDLTSKRTYGDGRTAEAVQAATPNTASAPAPRGVQPGQLVPLDAPSGRPDEPVTAGLPLGPGAGAEAMTQMPTFDDELFDLRALAARFPEYRGLTRLIALAESEK